MKRSIACGLVFIVTAHATAAFAHHSFAMFDFSKERKLVGVVREFRWANPHIHIVVDVPGANGAVESWDIEGSTPNSLRPRGWSRQSLLPGDKLTLSVHPLKNGTFGGSFVQAFYADGTAVGARPAAASPAAGN